MEAVSKPEAHDPKIGLALSGGGFRASIFHLGVIRRLEELGLMKKVSVISSVSGGSIIAAYYVIEMENRLRQRRDEILESDQQMDKVRLELFEEITKDFFHTLDHNLRTRALIFSPFYHPVGWIKCLFPGYSRSDLIQAEYDKWLFRNNTLDQFPAGWIGEAKDARIDVGGPKLVLNTTSLMSGERVGFSRLPLSGINEMKKCNKNVLSISKIVGASACVPGLFPPVPVSGDFLVDGGVSDNQGVEALMDDKCDVMLISDASGQIEQLHHLSGKALSVVGRTTSVLQFQVRNKLLDNLQAWKKEKNGRGFAFIHLFLNLKDRGINIPRVPSEFIPGIARIRTDLDQFSFIERESLMYHGYTLIDSQINFHCPGLLKGDAKNQANNQELKCPPLFQAVPDDGAGQEGKANRENEHSKRRERIKTVLEAGNQGVFLLRSLKKYPIKAGTVLFLTWLIPLLIIYFTGLYTFINPLAEKIIQAFLNWAHGLIPDWLASNLTNYIKWPITTEGAVIAVTFAILLYLLGFLTYLTMRRIVRKLDLDQYVEMTGVKKPSPRW